MYRYYRLGWILAIARYQPRPCGQQRDFAPTFFFEKYLAKVFFRKYFWWFFFGKYFWQQYFVLKNSRNYFFEKYFLRKYFFEKEFLAKMFLTKVFLAKIFLVKIFSAKIFFSYPSPIWLLYKQPPPLLSSTSVIFEVECDTTNETKSRTGRSTQWLFLLLY